MSKRLFGAIPGIAEGQTFENRIELSLSLVHRPRQAGISGSQAEGADSIVLSGGYEDDLDFGDVIVYTGHGGRDIPSGKQVVDQELTRSNLALAVSCQQGLPVRVIRGQNHRSEYSPQKGYRYDGLFRVEDYWKEKGKSGFEVWRFRMRQLKFLSNQIYEIQSRQVNEDEFEYGAPKRVETRITRIIRDTRLSKQVKEMYDFKCQVCKTRIETNAGPYAEAAHIKPLGAPHNGPDDLSNLLCLCPNHHVRFDYGGFSVSDTFDLIGEPGKLHVHSAHQINKTFLGYHREHRYEEDW
ncbi:YDG/SRA domain-containing protein [Lewinella sp. JB7]|uniref:YDG/SRA domain-containing protein n=1 Tax=Lewinella sp. JB7 TaxID=2962887 RepID=UPI0020C984CE|nr:YDG/SRA domain-containing protein [Lewinella sp. JB7]MCP9234706.1 HNH endonuclease [Lewinella sp. JB7]